MYTKQSLHGQKFSLKLIFINKKQKENVFVQHSSRTNVIYHTASILINNIFVKINIKGSNKFGQIFSDYITEMSWNVFKKITFKEFKNYKGKDDLFFF